MKVYSVPVYLNADIQASCWECTFSFVHYIWACYISEISYETAVLYSSFLSHFPVSLTLVSTDYMYLPKKRKLREVHCLHTGLQYLGKELWKNQDSKVKYLKMRKL